MEDFSIINNSSNGDLTLKFQDGTSAVLEYSQEKAASEFFSASVAKATPTLESKSGNRACFIELKNGKTTVLQFFGKTKEQANSLCSSGYTPQAWKHFLLSLSMVRLIRPDGTFSVVLCLPSGGGLGKDTSLEGCTF